MEMKKDTEKRIAYSLEIVNHDLSYHLKNVGIRIDTERLELKRTEAQELKTKIDKIDNDLLRAKFEKHPEHEDVSWKEIIKEMTGAKDTARLIASDLENLGRRILDLGQDLKKSSEKAETAIELIKSILD